MADRVQTHLERQLLALLEHVGGPVPADVQAMSLRDLVGLADARGFDVDLMLKRREPIGENRP
jgi:hypothetical protein